MSTTTGFQRHQDIGTNYIFELMRQSVAIAAELNNPTAAAPGLVQTFSVIRRVKTAAGNPASGIPDTYTLATGLTGIDGTVILPAAWNERPAAAGLPLLKTTERVIHLVDVPGSVVLPSDRIQYTDVIYGNQVFKITEVLPNAATNIVRCIVEYTREEGA